ncbi:MFS transporter [Thermodesulfobacteriota bacterium]
MKDNQDTFNYGYIIVAAIFLIMAVIWGTFACFGVFFEPLIKEFGWTRALASGSSSVRDLVFGVVCIFSARLIDLTGPRIVISISGLLLGLGYLLMSRVQTAWQLYLYYGVIISFGMSSYIPMLSIVAKWFERRRGMMTAVVLSGMGIGTMIMPPIASHLISTYGWRNSYVILAVIGFVLVVLAAQFLRHSPYQADHSISSDSSTDHVSSSGTTLLSFREALCTKQFWMLSVLYFFFLYALLTVLVHVAIRATGSGVSAKSAANILAIIGGACVIGMYGAGITADKIGNKRTLIISFVLMAISLLCLLVAETTRSFYVFAAIFGLSYGGMQVLFSPLVADLFGLGSHGVILGGSAFGGSIGAAMGPFMSGYIYDLTKSYNPAFIICLLMTILSVFLASFLKPVKK